MSGFVKMSRARVLALILLVSGLAGCAAPIPQDSVGSMSWALANQIGYQSKIDATKLDSKNNGMYGEFIEKKQYYISRYIFEKDDRLKPPPEGAFNSAFIEICRRKGGIFENKFCKKDDSLSGILFYAEYSRIKPDTKLFYSVPGPHDSIWSLVVYAKTAERSAEFERLMATEFNFKTKEEMRQKFEYSEKIRQIVANEAEEREMKAEQWRRTLKVGDNTFCGPVIEIRSPMVLIASKIAPKGFPVDTWLKMSEIYPSWMATCRVNIDRRPVADFNNY